MSTTIENQVVSMEFDNKRFESNVRTSLGTLDKLKQSLKLHDAAKGFENIGQAAGKVNLSPLSGAVDKVGLKFSALYTIADQTLRNIVNSVERTAKNIVSSFTIEPVKTGFQEYETQLNAIQTILANTQSKGATLEDVNSALDELNVYADKTIYNFTEMTRNIGTFTAAGVGLNESVSAIKGIANLAAISGSTSQQASTAMYQLSQALATGTVRLQDWNSVVNAGMGGEVFQNALKRTANHMGKNVDALIEKYGSFRESLTKGEWLTTEVLTETLAQLSGAYTEADLISQGYTEKQAKEIRELADTAVSAAQDVKTFTQLMDTLKESAQSGWSQTWRLIIGDFEESKSLWTSVSEVLGDIINKSSENRNKLLSGALDNSGWDKLVKVVDKAGIKVSDFEKEVEKVAKEHNIDIDKMVKEYGSLEGAVQACKIPVDILKKAFENLFGGGKKSGKFEEYTVKAGDTLSDLAKKWGTSVEEIMLINKNITDPDMIVTGWKIKIPKALEKTGEAAKDAGEHMESFTEALENVGKKGGRELLLESFGNIWTSFKKIFTGDEEKKLNGIADAFREVFPPMQSEQLMGLISGFNEFTKLLIPTDETVGKLSRTFRGLFSVLDILGYVLGGAVRIGFKIIMKIMESFDLNILDILASVGDAIYNFSQNIEKGIDGVIKFFKDLYMLPEVQKVLASLREEFGKLKEAFIGRWNKGVDAFWQWIERIKQLDGISLKNIGTALVDFKDNVLGAFFGTDDGGTIFDGLIDSVVKFWGVLKTKSSEVWTNLTEWFNRIKSLDGLSLKNIKTALVDFFKNVIKPIFVKEDGTTIFDSLKESIKNCWDTVKGWFSKLGINLDDLKNKIVAFFNIGDFNIGGIWTKTIDSFTKIKDGIIGFVTGIGDFLSKHKGTIFVIGTFITILLLVKKAFDIVGTVAEAIGFLSDIGEGFKRFTKDLGKSLRATAIKSIAESLAILVAAIAVLALLPKDQMWSAVGAMAVISGVVVGVFALASLITKKMGSADLTKFAVSILAVAGSLMVFALAAKTLGAVEWESLGKAGAILGAMLLFTVILNVVSKKSAGLGNAMNGFGKMLIGLGGFLLMVAGAVLIFGRMDDDTLKKGLMAVTVMLVELIAVMAATNLLAKVGKKQSLVKMGSIAMGLGTALLMMATAVAIFGHMDAKTLIKGGAAIGACIVMLIGVMGATKLLARTSDNGSIVKVGGLFASLGAALLMMAASVAIFGNMRTETLIKGGAAVLVFLGAMVGIMAATKLLAVAGNGGSFPKVAGMIMSFAGAILVMSIAVAVLSTMDFKDLMKSTMIITGLGVVLMGLVSVTRNIPTKAAGALLAITGMIAVLAGSIILLSYIDSDKLAIATVAIGGVIGVVALLTAALKGPAISGKQILGLAGALAAILAVVAVFAAIGVASLPAIGAKMSEFMAQLASENGFLSGLEKLSKIQSISPGLIESVGTLFAAIGTLAAGAADFSIANAITNGGAGRAMAAFKDWIAEILPVVVSMGMLVSKVDINTENLKAVVGAASDLAAAAALAPTVDVAVGGFGTKWGGGGGTVIGVPLLSAAKDWIKEVVPVVTDAALDVSDDGITINKDNLDAVCGAATKLAEAAALAPSIDIAGGGFTSKWVTGGGGVIDWPLLRQAKDWMKEVVPLMQDLAGSISGECKDLDGDLLTTVCNGATILAQAAALAPEVEIAGGAFTSKWVSGGGGVIEFPLLTQAKDWIVGVKDAIIDLSKSLSSEDVKDLDGDLLTKVCEGASILAGAAAKAPSVTAMGGLIEAGVTLGIVGAISIPMIGRLAWFIDNVREPIIKLAAAVSGYAGEGETALKDFKADDFNTIVGGVKTLSEAVQNAPKVEAGALLSFGGFTGATFAFAISHPMINSLTKFINDVREPMVALANSVSGVGGADAEKMNNFDEKKFNTIIDGIVKMAGAAKEAPTIDGGLLLNFNKFSGITLATGVSWPEVTATGEFISNATTPILTLAKAVSEDSTGDTSSLKNLNTENFTTIVDAIVKLSSVTFASTTVGGGLAAAHGIVAVGLGVSHPEVKATADFISNVSDPIISLANAVSGVSDDGITKLQNFNPENFKAIVQGIVDIASVKLPTYGEGVIVGGGGNAAALGVAAGYAREFADMAGTVKFITDVKDPIIELANAVSGVGPADATKLKNLNVDNFKTIVQAIVDLSSIDINTVTGGGGGGLGLSGALAGGFIGGAGGSSFADFEGTVGFINKVREPVISLAKAVSEQTDGAPEITEEGKANLEAIVDAIVKLSEVNVPKKVDITGGLFAIVGIGFDATITTQFTEFANFVSEVTGPITKMVKEVSAKDFNVDTVKVEQVVGIISSLAKASKDLPQKSEIKWGFLDASQTTDFTGFVDFLAGTDGTDGVGAALVKLDTAVKDLELGDGSKATQAVGIISTLATASNQIPETEKWAIFKSKSADFTGFTEFIGNAGESIKTMTGKLTDISISDLELAITAARAVKILAEASQMIPDESWTGGTNWATFSAYIEKFGENIAKFAGNVEGQTFDKALQAAESIKLMATGFAEIGNLLHNMEVNPDDLVNYLYTLLDGTAVEITDFNTALEGVNLSNVNTAATIVRTMVDATSLAAEQEGKSVAQFSLNVASVTSTLSDFATSTADVNPTTGIANLNSLVTALSSMNGVSFTGASSFKEALSDLADTSISDFVSAFSSEETSTAVTDAVSGMTSTAVTAAKSESAYQDFYSAGTYVVDGFKAGLEDSKKIAAVISAAEAMVRAAITAAEDEADINSPSKEFYRIATFCGMGLSNAFHDYEDRAYSDGRGLADAATRGLSNAISKVGYMVENGIDSQPTIRPVLDLSDVSSGAKRINGMFGMQPSVGLLSKVGTINTMMNGLQNGNNDDVISAINDLGKRLGRVSGPTTIVNGVTYDDGSNVTKAVETLVRAAIRERRV